jgi:chromosome segregation ATPase
MLTIAINVTLVALIALPIGAAILGITIHFFLKSRRLMNEALQANKSRSISSIPQSKKTVTGMKDEIAELEKRLAMQRLDVVIQPAPPAVSTPEKSPKKFNTKDENVVRNLKDTIAEQQEMLNEYLKQVEDLENENRMELSQQNEELQNEIKRLETIVAKKDNDIDALKQQAGMVQKMSDKIEEVYREFELLQEKMTTLESQAAKANTMAIELEDAKQSYEQLFKDVSRKQEKLEDAMMEAQRLRQELEITEDKLAEANFQRQQMQRKIQFLQDMNTDMLSMSETNKKLQTELRRIGELESMLNMMSEERDFLLRKQDKK